MRIGIVVTTNIYYFKSALTYFRLLKYFLSILRLLTRGT